MYESFEAITEYIYNGALRTTEISADLLPPNNMEQCMMIKGDEEWIYITKEQAMKFFGLVDPEDINDSDNERHRAYFSHR